MLSSCTLECQMASSYLRNNRSTKQKSLRCFPACSLKGHVSSGFCGRPLRVTAVLLPEEEVEEDETPESKAELEKDPSHIVLIPTTFSSNNGIIKNNKIVRPKGTLTENKSFTIHDYMFIAELRTSNAPKLSSQTRVNKNYLMSQIRTRYDSRFSFNNMHSNLMMKVAAGAVASQAEAANQASTTSTTSTTSSTDPTEPQPSELPKDEAGTPNNEETDSNSDAASSSKPNNKSKLLGRELFLGEVVILNNLHSTSSSSEPNSNRMEFEITFNSQHHSWDYSWRSNRWSAANEQHVVDIIVLRYDKQFDDFIVTSSFSTSPFYVTSSHKRGTRKTLGFNEGNDENSLSNVSNSLNSGANSSTSSNSNKKLNQTETEIVRALTKLSSKKKLANGSSPNSPNTTPSTSSPTSPSSIAAAAAAAVANNPAGLQSLTSLSNLNMLSNGIAMNSAQGQNWLNVAAVAASAAAAANSSNGSNPTTPTYNQAYINQKLLSAGQFNLHSHYIAMLQGMMMMIPGNMDQSFINPSQAQLQAAAAVAATVPASNNNSTNSNLNSALPDSLPLDSSLTTTSSTSSVAPSSIDNNISIKSNSSNPPSSRNSGTSTPINGATALNRSDELTWGAERLVAMALQPDLKRRKVE